VVTAVCVKRNEAERRRYYYRPHATAAGIVLAAPAACPGPVRWRTVGPGYPLTEERIHMLFVETWTNKYLTSEATSVEEMAQILQAAADLFRQMARDGVALDSTDFDRRDDLAWLSTSDPEVAAKYQFEEVDLGECEEAEAV
jgi:hypothetical protein